MKTKIALLLISAFLLTGCNNFIHELIPKETADDPVYYTVTFDKNNTDSGSTEANPQTAAVADGGTVNPLPTPPARTGYSFGGWYESADGGATLGAEFTASAPVTTNITVYARWVTGSTGSLNIVYTDGSTETIDVFGSTYTLPVRSKTFYSFTFSAPGFPAAAILIGRRADDSSPVTLAFNPVGPHELVLRAPIVGGAFDGFRPIGSFAEFQLINTNSTTLGGRYMQEAGLDLLGDSALDRIGGGVTRQEWTRIGGYNTATAFTGTYDGNGKDITNLYINKPSSDNNDNNYQGLFGYLSGNA
jgi:uncharacterized repeat protein (TIGR02543 family)